jgi:hypothetical protein
MSKHAFTIPDSVAHLFQAGPLQTLFVIALSALVGAAGAAAAISRYRPATACTTETVSAPVVPPQPLAPLPSEPLPLAAIELPPAAAIETPVENRTDATPAEGRAVSDSVPSAAVKAERRASKESVSEEHVVPKWTGDWQAATARLNSNREASSAATAASAAPGAKANAVADASSGASDAAAPVPVTISGCLEMSVDAERFRLADTEGADVPKVRSWRSGFLKKQAAPVELLELPATARKYVGRRVTATGVVENRDMRVQTLQVSGNACN